jgi:hypothetical protein
MRVLAVLQIEAELREQPGDVQFKRSCASSPVSANSSGVAQAARCRVARGKTPDGSRRTACITGFAVPFAFAAKRRYL